MHRSTRLSREGRKLATQIAAAINQSGAKFVLLTSVDEGDGKTFLAKMLRREWSSSAMERLDIVDWSRLATLIPADFTPAADHMVLGPDGRPTLAPVVDEATIVVDGPPMLAGDEILDIPPLWMEAFDAAVVVVMKRRTLMHKVEETIEWLRAADITPIGVVWNEHHFPPVLGRLSSLREWLAEALG